MKTNNNKENIFIVGPLPPPIGGVGIYLERFIEKNKDKYHVKLLDYSKLNKFRQLLSLIFMVLIPFKGSIYVNHINTLIFLSLLIRPYPNHLIFYDHNFRFMERLNKTGQKIFKSFLLKTDEIHVVNEVIIDYYAKYGLDIRKKTKLKLPFLPPIIHQESSIVETYPPYIKDIISGKNMLLVANAFRLEFYQNTDLYGADICIELTKMLVKKYAQLKFIFFVSKVENPYHREISERIVSYNLSESFYLLTGQYQFWPILKYCVLFIRPTCTDGDAISIREALYFKKPVVASDVVSRPDGVSLFKNRDINDLYKKALVILEKKFKN